MAMALAMAMAMAMALALALALAMAMAMALALAKEYTSTLLVIVGRVRDGFSSIKLVLLGQHLSSLNNN